jgi:glycine betaine/proline transport system substrate-binding protein
MEHERPRIVAARPGRSRPGRLPHRCAVAAHPERPNGRRRQDCGDLNIAVNPWVGYEADAHVVGYVAKRSSAATSTTRTSRRRSRWQGFGTARSTSSSRTGATPTSRRSTSTGGDGSAVEDSARPATTASSAGTSRRGWPRSTRTSPTGRTSTSTPTLQDLRVRRQGHSCSTATRLRDQRRGAGEEPDLNYKVVYAGSEAALIEAFRRPRRTRAAARLLLRAAVVPSRGPAGQGRPAEVHRRLRRRRGEGRLRLPAVRAQQGRLQEVRRLRSPAVDLVKNFTWTNDDQNVVAKYIAAGQMDPEDAAKKWVDKDEPRQGRRLARRSWCRRRGRCARRCRPAG